VTNVPSIARRITPDEEGRIREAQRRLAEAERQAQERVQRALAMRDAEILRACEQGASQASIGRVLGITRQAVALAVRRAKSND
jgi:hypothetical protein